MPIRESFLLLLSVIAPAKLGDKTQLIVIYLSARFRQPFAVLSGLLVGAMLKKSSSYQRTIVAPAPAKMKKKMLARQTE